MSLFRVSITGSLLDENNKYPATVPVPLPIVFSQIEGAYTAFDRKIWLLLLHLEWDNLIEKSGSGKWHEVSEPDLRTLIEKYSGSKDLERLWDSIKRLTKTHVEYWYIDENDERWEGATTIFMGVYKPKQKRDGIVRFMFPPPLIPIILEPGRFARLRVEFMFKLDSKYAITLYQVLESVANLRVPVLGARVEEIRRWLKVPEGKLKTWQNLFNKALFPALKEINSNPELSGVNVEYELIRSGKGGKVQEVKFTVHKTPCRIILENKVKTDKKVKGANNITQFIPQFKGTEIFNKAKKLAPDFDIYHLHDEWREWVSKSNVVVKKPEAHFMAFVKKRAQRKNLLIKKLRKSSLYIV